MAASASASRRRWQRPAATSRSGAATPRRTRAPPRPWPAAPARSIPASATSAIPPRSRRRWRRRWSAFGRVDGCFANAGIGGGGRRAFIDRTEEEWRKHVRHQSRRRLPCVSGRGAPHDRARRIRRSASAGWSRPRASPRCSAPRATSIMPRPRPPSTRWSARSRSNWRATASPPTLSCPAGSRAT